MLKITETNVTIMITDMDKAIAFYQQIGFEIKQRWENHYAMLTTTGLTIGLHPGGEGMAATDKISIGLMIEDINEAKALLEKNNITYKLDDGGSGTYLHFKDADSNTIYYCQPKWR